MKKNTAAGLALRIWFFTPIFYTILVFIFSIGPFDSFGFYVLPVLTVIGSFPVFILLWLTLTLLKKSVLELRSKIIILVFIEVLCVSPYAIVSSIASDYYSDSFTPGLVNFIALLSCALISTFAATDYMISYFTKTNHIYNHSSIKQITMQTEQEYPAKAQSNKILFKGLIAGGLVLIMLIPTLIVQNLVSEREARQQQVVKEVSAKWATSQTLAGPFILLPYTESAIDKEGKPVLIKKEVVILSQKMDVTGEVIPVNRPRSIYKVLLYKSDLNVAGSFQPKWPTNIDTSRLDFANAKLCLGISDFKGIEEEININFNNKNLVFSPDLPQNNIAKLGLSVPVILTYENFNAGIKYKMNVKLKGSERLHFMPLSANSSFALKSAWPNPSFDGNSLPNERIVNANGFEAKWNYNQANLPFGTVFKNEVDIASDLSFGLSMVQPADQYNKTMRSIKYAILIIGLTFALFFIIEIMQGRPFHPVQYVLVGLALVIFYTLLLAISEYIIFDYAYLVASAATVILIALYAKSHFQSWKTATVFAAVLSMLYGFIFILLRLEDTALLVGSIGLFIVLALVMYVSRKVNWYGANSLSIN